MPPARQPSEPFRPNVYLVTRFLDALARPDVVMNKAQLQAAVGVNYDILRRYLEFLEAKRFIVVRDPGGRGNDSIVLTQEGRSIRAEIHVWLARLLGEYRGT